MSTVEPLPRAVFLMGPTVAGKTSLAMQLYDSLPCELISVDSALIYRGMDVGTAKPTLAEQQRYPHHLIDIIDPTQSYSAGQFRSDALALMQDISARGKLPILVGGTMMYFNALLKGLAVLPDGSDEIRAQINSLAEQQGWPAVHAQLARVDSSSAARLAPNDAQRISRALEVFKLTGQSITEHWKKQQVEPFPYDVLNLAVMPSDRKVLHLRIENRFHKMLKEGFVEEMQSLYDRGDLNKNMPSIRCVGYRQYWMYLNREIDHSTMIDKSIIATRQLAKRQITWLRSWQDLHWLDPQAVELTARVLKLIDSDTI